MNITVKSKTIIFFSTDLGCFEVSVLQGTEKKYVQTCMKNNPKKPKIKHTQILFTSNLEIHLTM